MNDKEMLELAAKAVGMTLGAWNESYGAFMFRDARPGAGYWNPLAIDGDALRLAVKLRMDIVHFESGVRADVTGYDDCHEENSSNPYAATRRAIVRAAAEIGKAVQKPLAP